MDIFYIEIEKYKNILEKDFLKNYLDIDVKTEKRFFEYTLGRYLVKNVAKTIYGIEDTDIIIEKSKPIFKNSKVHFSISHSKEYIIAAFSEKNCGCDIEKILPRNLNKFSKYYKRKFNNLSEFYEYWTKKEALIKLGTKEEPTKTNSAHTKFKENYMIAIAPYEDKIEIKEIDKPF